MSIEFTEKEYYSMDDLLEIVQLLRSPEGCPWDRVQTHESIRTNFLEETHEVLEAIDTKNVAGLREELGDVLLQILLHSIMEEEQHHFSYHDVVDELAKKLVIRHPHVFGNVIASNEDEALQSWDAIKRKTKNTDKQSDLLRHVPKSLPSLMRAEKVQNRARRVGFDWDSIDGAWDALSSEIVELKEAISQNEINHIEEELGDVLFSVVNVSRFLNLDSEKALLGSVEKFVSRFTKVEQLAKEKNIDMINASMTQLDELWEEAKK